MTYVAFAVYYEGSTDRSYFNVLLPKIMQELVLQHGVRHSTIPEGPVLDLARGSVDDVAVAFCKEKQAVHLLFVHADTGGRNLERDMHGRAGAYCERVHALCGWPPERCVMITPRHETEAWALADAQAIADALGYRGNLSALKLPADGREAERLRDPKAELTRVIEQVRGRRNANPHALMSAVAQAQSLERLRTAPTFQVFETHLWRALHSLGCL